MMNDSIIDTLQNYNFEEIKDVQDYLPVDEFAKIQEWSNRLSKIVNGDAVSYLFFINSPTRETFIATNINNELIYFNLYVPLGIFYERDEENLFYLYVKRFNYANFVNFRFNLENKSYNLSTVFTVSDNEAVDETIEQYINQILCYSERMQKVFKVFLEDFGIYSEREDDWIREELGD